MILWVCDCICTHAGCSAASAETVQCVRLSGLGSVGMQPDMLSDLLGLNYQHRQDTDAL